MTIFDLQKAKDGSPLCTRDGHEVVGVEFLEQGTYCIDATVKFYDEYGAYYFKYRYLADGSYIKGVETVYDLMMK